MMRILFLALLMAFATTPVLASSEDGAEKAAEAATEEAKEAATEAAAEGEKVEGEKKKKGNPEDDCE